LPELLPLKTYSDRIELDAAFDRRVESRYGRSILLRELAGWLLADAGWTTDVPPGDPERRQLIKKLLTVRPPRPIPAAILDFLDQLFGEEAAEREVTHLDAVLFGSQDATRVRHTEIRIWRGDVTQLAADAIVNAANADLLGCFRPEHACIDNAIHSGAGPRLREDCRRIIEVQGHKEPTGTSKATRAYFLPSRFVLHTVGPIVRNASPTAVHRASLASCYESCLDVAAAISARSIAFCGISTGVFGYPKVDAARVAMGTVRQWLETRPDRLDAVIFNVFGESDHRAYRETWGSVW
jgi:O-acetyl-ADP-ribose deacetylase (regulator of RNase III)